MFASQIQFSEKVFVQLKKSQLVEARSLVASRGGDLSFSCEQFHDPLETLTRCRDGRLKALDSELTVSVTQPAASPGSPNNNINKKFFSSSRIIAESEIVKVILGKFFWVQICFLFVNFPSTNI